MSTHRSPDAAAWDGARAFYEGLAGPKGIAWAEGDQLDFYDQPAQVSLATEAIVAHFDDVVSRDRETSTRRTGDRKPMSEEVVDV